MSRNSYLVDLLQQPSRTPRYAVGATVDVFVWDDNCAYAAPIAAVNARPYGVSYLIRLSPRRTVWVSEGDIDGLWPPEGETT